MKKWCLEHGEESPTHKSAAIRHIDDDATGVTITFAEHGGKPVVRIQNEGSEHVGRYVLEPDEVFFVTLRERTHFEIDHPLLPTEADTRRLDIKCELSQENIRCAYCEVLGHMTSTCPKYAKDYPRG